MRKLLGPKRIASMTASVTIVLTVALAGTAGAARPPAVSAASSLFASHVFANGATLSHVVAGHAEALSDPDDITTLAGSIYVAFQNGVGPQGQASTTGNRDSTVVELSAAGAVIKQWELVGKCDGLTADPNLDEVIATINEDANSSLYLIAPGASAVHYHYNKGGLAHGGGTDAISIYRGVILISASAPGTTGAAAPQATYPAVYRVLLDGATQTAAVKPLFFDEDFAVEANPTSPQYGQMEHLYLTDPDSNEVVPSFASRFAGDFMLTSQGDEEQIFVSGAGGPHQKLSVLQLSASVDDTAWPSDGTGALYAVSTDLDTIDSVTGPFTIGAPIVAVTPCDENSAPATCPGPGYPTNYLGRLNPITGVISRLPVSGASVRPQGLLFMPAPQGLRFAPR